MTPSKLIALLVSCSLALIMFSSMSESSLGSDTCVNYVAMPPFVVILSDVTPSELLEAVVGPGNVENPYPVRLEGILNHFPSPEGRSRYVVTRGGLGLETGLKLIQFLTNLPAKDAKVTITYEGGSSILQLRQTPDARLLGRKANTSVLAGPREVVRAAYTDKCEYAGVVDWLLFASGMHGKEHAPLLVNEWELHIMEQEDGQYIYSFIPYRMTPHTNVKVAVVYDNQNAGNID
jgi:hypothetical protein